MKEESFQLIDGILTGDTSIRVYCGRGAVVENYGKVCSYSPQLFVLDSKQYRIIIRGRNMDIREISKECLVLDGDVTGAEITRESEEI